MLAREAADALGLPVTVHRCGLIMAHTTCALCLLASCMHATLSPPWHSLLGAHVSALPQFISPSHAADTLGYTWAAITAHLVM